jgi:A/G-specific adenine glycosylase
MTSSAAAKTKRRTELTESSASRPTLLLDWYDRHRRRLPWRPPAGERPDPYRVWLSEIMLQQTGVKTVGPYFEKFLARWPDVASLGRASQDDVLRMWAGLGYYSRARNLHACAVAVLRDHGAVFPDTEQGLLKLPGIGPYTAAAISNAWCRGFTLWKTRYRRRSRAYRNWRRHCWALLARATVRRR